MISGLAMTLVFGALWIAVIAWLCGRTHVWSRRAGVLLAAVVASYCAGVALILVIGSVDDGDSLRSGGFLSVLTFALIACATAWSAGRVLVKT
jgi:hypothetical protein